MKKLKNNYYYQKKTHLQNEEDKKKWNNKYKIQWFIIKFGEKKIKKMENEINILKIFN